MDKIKALWAAFTANPVKFLKFLIFSLDHSERGASIKKLISIVIAACIAGLHYAWYKYQASSGNFTQFMSILWFDGALMGALLGFNLIQEAHSKSLDSDK